MFLSSTTIFMPKSKLPRKSWKYLFFIILTTSEISRISGKQIIRICICFACSAASIFQKSSKSRKSVMFSLSYLFCSWSIFVPKAVHAPFNNWEGHFDVCCVSRFVWWFLTFHKYRASKSYAYAYDLLAQQLRDVRNRGNQKNITFSHFLIFFALGRYLRLRQITPK